MNPRIARLWRRRLADLDASLLPIAKWCDLNNVSRTGVALWRRRLASERSEPLEQEGGRWLSVRVEEAQSTLEAPPNPVGLTLRVGNTMLDVRLGFDPALLRAVVQALGGSPC